MTTAPDGGLQPERTRLAWRRTSLAVVLGGALAVRLLPPVLGTFGLVCACGVLVAGALLALLAERRSHQLRRRDPSGASLPGIGGLTLVLTVCVTLAALLAAVVVVLRAQT